jgi:uncharacterized membrane protein
MVALCPDSDLLYLTAWLVYSRENLREAFDFIITGLNVTIVTSIVAYAIAICAWADHRDGTYLSKPGT